MSKDKALSKPAFQASGTAQRLSLPTGPPVVRIVQNNPGPFTGPGTNTFVVGDAEVWLVDPGEAGDEDHRERILQAVDSRPVAGVALTHSHGDHWPLGANLARDLEAPLLAFADQPVEGPHRDFAPNRLIGDGEVLRAKGAVLHCIHTPGHCADHLSFAVAENDEMPERPIVLCGDHVMAWSSTILAPPDGSLNDYLDSIDRLLALDPQRLLPAHGPAIEEPRARLEELRDHRHHRSRQLLEALQTAGPTTLVDIVPIVYADTDPSLHRAAAFSLQAHVDALIAGGQIVEQAGVLALAE